MAIPDLGRLFPTFGLLPDIAWGMTRHLDFGRPRSIHDFLPPPHLRHLHDPWFFAMLWDRLLAAIRDPVKVHEGQDGRRLVEVLGDMVLEQAADGQLSIRLWQCKVIGSPCLVDVTAFQFVLQGSPWKRLWLYAMAEGAALEVFSWATQHMPGRVRRVTETEARVYTELAFDCFNRQIRRHCDLRVMRRKIALALKLNPWVMQVATRLIRLYPLPSTLLVAQYNLVLRHRAAFASLWREAPHMVALFGALCEAGGFPQHGEPLERLKAYLRGQRISERTWRRVVQGNARFLVPVRAFYNGGIGAAVLDYLRCIDCLGAQVAPPLWLLREFLSLWGHAGMRRSDYSAYFASARVGYDHMAGAFLRHYGRVDTPDNTMLDELDLVLRWERDSKEWPHADKHQRRAGWQWLVRQARRWNEAQLVALSVNPEKWTVPFESLQWGGLTVVALADELALWEEGRAMHHCANSLVDGCRNHQQLILSVRREGRRLCTLGLRWKDNGWQFWQATGRANTQVALGTMKALAGLIGHINQRVVRAEGRVAQ